MYLTWYNFFYFIQLVCEVNLINIYSFFKVCIYLLQMLDACCEERTLQQEQCFPPFALNEVHYEDSKYTVLKDRFWFNLKCTTNIIGKIHPQCSFMWQLLVKTKFVCHWKVKGMTIHKSITRTKEFFETLFMGILTNISILSFIFIFCSTPSCWM